MRRNFTFLSRFLYLAASLAVFLAAPYAAQAQSTYTGPQQLSLNQANVTGSCDCGSSISGGSLTSAIAFAPILSVVIKQIITDSEGNVEEIIYEDMVAVVEMEKVGNDYYVKFFEMRKEDVNSWIAGRNKPGNIYYMVGAEEYLESQGSDTSDLGDALPDGVNVQELQIFELPPEDTYNYMFFEEPGTGRPITLEEFLALFQ